MVLPLWLTFCSEIGSEAHANSKPAKLSRARQMSLGVDEAAGEQQFILCKHGVVAEPTLLAACGVEGDTSMPCSFLHSKVLSIEKRGCDSSTLFFKPLHPCFL